MGFFKRILNNGEKNRDTEIPISDARFVALDTELTGLDKKKDAIVSLGAVKMVGGRIDMGETFYQLVNPGKALDASSVIIHEITPSEVMQRPAIASVLRGFLEFCSDNILLGHFISLDLAFLNRDARANLGYTITNPAADTLVMADWLKWNSPPGGKTPFNPSNYQLYEIARELGIPPQGAHNALMDAFMTAQVFQRLIPRLKQHGIDTVKRLLEIANPARKLKQPGMVI